MNKPQVHMCSPILTLLPPPFPFHPSGLSQSTGFECSNLHWSSILHTVIYMLQFYCLKSSHPHLLPQSPKACSLYLCLFYCLAYHVSCIKPGLVICFTLDNIHVSMLFCQVIPPSPSSTESKSLFFTPLSLFLSHLGSSLPSF